MSENCEKITDIMKGAKVDFINCKEDANGNILSISLTMKNGRVIDISSLAWNETEDMPEYNSWLEIDCC